MTIQSSEIVFKANSIGTAFSGVYDADSKVIVYKNSNGFWDFFFSSIENIRSGGYATKIPGKGLEAISPTPLAEGYITPDMAIEAATMLLYKSIGTRFKWVVDPIEQ